LTNPYFQILPEQAGQNNCGLFPFPLAALCLSCRKEIAASPALLAMTQPADLSRKESVVKEHPGLGPLCGLCELREKMPSPFPISNLELRKSGKGDDLNAEGFTAMLP